jgi:hypothetical protein
VLGVGTVLFSSSTGHAPVFRLNGSLNTSEDGILDCSAPSYTIEMSSVSSISAGTLYGHGTVIFHTETPTSTAQPLITFTKGSSGVRDLTVIRYIQLNAVNRLLADVINGEPLLYCPGIDSVLHFRANNTSVAKRQDNLFIARVSSTSSVTETHTDGTHVITTTTVTNDNAEKGEITVTVTQNVQNTETKEMVETTTVSVNRDDGSWSVEVTRVDTTRPEEIRVWPAPAESKE